MGEGIVIEELFAHWAAWQVIDVRSPAEFQTGHIPGAVNIPLFSDDERAVIGTLYKQTSPEAALQKGLEIAGTKMAGLVSILQPLVHQSERKLLIHCWRGGKRSKAVHWLTTFAGMKAYVLEGGYKQYRRAMQQYFSDSSVQFNILGGCTGSGKTEVLYALQALGEQIVDLEKLANHKGSAFGSIGEAKQPTTEQFENNLFFEFLQLDSSRPIWLENESKSIGKVYLPDALWKKMRSSVLFTIDVDKEVRLKRALKYYSDSVDVEILKASFDRIKKRLGGLEYQNAIESLEQKDLRAAAAIALAYYDKSYTYQMSHWPSEKCVHIEPCNEISDIAQKLIQAACSY
jgi:tRNA 2-selenouridine synthase